MKKFALLALSFLPCFLMAQKLPLFIKIGVGEKTGIGQYFSYYDADSRDESVKPSVLVGLGFSHDFKKWDFEQSTSIVFRKSVVEQVNSREQSDCGVGLHSAFLNDRLTLQNLSVREEIAARIPVSFKKNDRFAIRFSIGGEMWVATKAVGETLIDGQDYGSTEKLKKPVSKKIGTGYSAMPLRFFSQIGAQAYLTKRISAAFVVGPTFSQAARFGPNNNYNFGGRYRFQGLTAQFSTFAGLFK